MNLANAEVLFDALLARGFMGGLDCSLFCPDGYYGMRLNVKKMGQPKSERCFVSCTPMDRAEEFKAAVETGDLLRHEFHNGTYTITDWRPSIEPARAVA